MKIVERWSNKEEFFCKKTRPAILESPILQAKTNTQQYLCGIIIMNQGSIFNSKSKTAAVFIFSLQQGCTTQISWQAKFYFCSIQGPKKIGVYSLLNGYNEQR